jgi:hypothetical protein
MGWPIGAAKKDNAGNELDKLYTVMNIFPFPAIAY